MRFLCLHGMGTNSRIFEAQTAAIRYGLGHLHTYEYVDGALPTSMAPGVDVISGLEDEYLQYGDDTSPGSYRKALDDLETLVDQEGPFDGVMAFSQGAGLAAALMVRKLWKDPQHARLNPVFRCAIFFCGGVPWDPLIPGDGKATSRLLSFEADGELIHIPSAHIWGAHDQGGHEIPGPKDPEGVLNAVRVIKRAIQRSNQGQ